ncbi:zinc-ribbon domain-containing protein [Myxococcota bacterium]|nr:zinc-ribbon domain-containing protein [Myxococcota bacterium]MBU1380002.1 zinc-ribbon domain-containing protein [Myxococcota bacterium]MBU1496759.1 zinc-ribbon domain-containing protein [Myxococcota bacterium]
MKIICDSCQTKYSISDDKLSPGKVFKIKCKKCGHIIVVKPPEEAAAPEEDATRVVDYNAMNQASSPAPTETSGKEWFVVLDKDQEGPFTRDEIKEKIASGLVKHDTFTWKEGQADWKEISKIPELSDLLPAVSSAPAKSDDPFSGFDEPAKSEPAPAAAASSDIFGQSEKKDALFPEDDQKEDDAPKMKGQRHENSVLFSLDNLQSLASGGSSKKPTGASSRPGYITPESQGSGLVDIQQMANSMQSSKPASQSMPIDLPAAPVLATPLASAPLFAPIQEEEKKPKWMIPAIIAGVVVFAVLAFLVVKVMGGGDKKDSTSKPEVAKKGDDKGDDKGSMKAEVALNTMGGDMKPEDKTDDMKPDTKPDDMKPENKTDDMKPDTKPDDMKPDTKPDDMKPDTKVGKPDRKPDGGKKPPKDMTTDPKPDMTEPAPMDGNCTKVWCMLNGNKPACCKQYTGGGGDSNAGGDPCASHGQESLSKSDITSGIGRVRGAVKACFTKTGTSGKVMVRITVKCMGNVVGAAARAPHAGTPLGNCVQRAVYGARFPKFKKSTMSFTYPFIG